LVLFSLKIDISSIVCKFVSIKKCVCFWLQSDYEKKAKQFFSTSLLFTKSWNSICVKFVAKLLVCLEQLQQLTLLRFTKR
jgi:hypothetical protein